MQKLYNKQSNNELISLLNQLTIKHESQKNKMLSIVDQLEKEEKTLYNIEDNYKEIVEILQERRGIDKKQINKEISIN